MFFRAAASAGEVGVLADAQEVMQSAVRVWQATGRTVSNYAQSEKRKQRVNLLLEGVAVSSVGEAWTPDGRGTSTCYVIRGSR